jgi:hypothetical protein
MYQALRNNFLAQIKEVLMKAIYKESNNKNLP